MFCLTSCDCRWKVDRPSLHASSVSWSPWICPINHTPPASSSFSALNESFQRRVGSAPLEFCNPSNHDKLSLVTGPVGPRPAPSTERDPFVLEVKRPNHGFLDEVGEFGQQTHQALPKRRMTGDGVSGKCGGCRRLLDLVEQISGVGFPLDLSPP